MERIHLALEARICCTLQSNADNRGCVYISIFKSSLVWQFAYLPYSLRWPADCENVGGRALKNWGINLIDKEILPTSKNKYVSAYKALGIFGF